MSEQTIQDSLYSIPVTILDKYTCLSLGATTINDLIKTGKLKSVKVSKNLSKKPDVLIVNKNKEVVVFLEFKTPDELNTQTKIDKAIKQEISVAREIGAKIYVVTDGDKYIWLNPITGNMITDDNGTPITRKIEPKNEPKKLAEFIDLVSLSVSSDNDTILKLEDIDPTDLAKKIARILKRMTFASSKMSLYTFVEVIRELNDLKEAVSIECSATDYKEFLISELYTPKNGNSNYTKEWCQEHQGDIPLYSGNTFGAFDHIDVADYDGEYITWAKDGLAGYTMYHNGKFSLTGHRGLLIPKGDHSDIDVQYIRLMIEPIFRKNIKGRLGINGKNEYTTLNSAMIKSIKDKIQIPVKADGSFDLNKQKDLAQKFATIESIKENIHKQVRNLTNIIVV